MASKWFVEWRERDELRRLPLDRPLSVGRSRSCDITLDDPYVSRVHCTIEPGTNHILVDATRALNHIRVGGRDVEAATLAPGDIWQVGNTTMRVAATSRTGDETTLRLEGGGARPAMVLRRSTRELIGPSGSPVLRFSPSEGAAFEVLARKYPDAASHNELGQAIWNGLGFDQYQLHRLMQRIRQRLGENGEILENVRGAGYRLRVAVMLA
ncbi:MAG: FHA domain-containing protein [Dehalococcoidia bacterium]|nr:FHA domain-containing protein [Dehalococcoidia bacterium]